jgi:hypothetical protein
LGGLGAALSFSKRVVCFSLLGCYWLVEGWPRLPGPLLSPLLLPRPGGSPLSPEQWRRVWPRPAPRCGSLWFLLHLGGFQGPLWLSSPAPSPQSTCPDVPGWGSAGLGVGTGRKQFSPQFTDGNRGYQETAILLEPCPALLHSVQWTSSSYLPGNSLEIL